LWCGDHLLQGTSQCLLCETKLSQKCFKRKTMGFGGVLWLEFMWKLSSTSGFYLGTRNLINRYCRQKQTVVQCFTHWDIATCFCYVLCLIDRDFTHIASLSLYHPHPHKTYTVRHRDTNHTAHGAERLGWELCYQLNVPYRPWFYP